MTPEITPLWGVRHPVASGTHAFAFILALFGAWLLWRRAGGQWRARLAVTSFALSMLILYAASALYHAVRVPSEQLRYYLLVDMSAIYVLIAGTYTPVLLVIPGRLRRTAFFATVWLIALVGIAFKIMGFIKIVSLPPYWMSALLYLSMGWLGLALIRDIVRAVGFAGLRWLIYGGIAYSLGAIVDIQQEPSLWPGVFGYHELFHILAVIGTLCHFVFVWQFVIPYAVVPSSAPCAQSL